MGRSYTVTIEFSPSATQILNRLMTWLEGSADIQKQIDDAAKVIGDISADTQANLANASKS